MGKDMGVCGLPPIDKQDVSFGDFNREINDQYELGVSDQDLHCVDKLNPEQRVGYNLIMDFVHKKKGQVFFIDGPGGIRKTFLYKALIATVRSEGNIAFATATSEQAVAGDYVDLPSDINIKYEEENSINELIDRIFPDLYNNASCTEYMSERGILCMRNDYVDGINARMIGRFPGEEKVFYSFDAVEDDSKNNYPQDFLNSITPNEMVNGTHAGERLFIPRIPMSLSEDRALPFKFKRKQFPV
ncbi:hypothetical protein QOZ80_5AG0379610 [Eleusine coracana subsp. coracana]|nr:hypothetical protein QOZ80_5AG0379610 [Eleusine coracana subsp. coracana]